MTAWEEKKIIARRCRIRTQDNGRIMFDLPESSLGRKSRIGRLAGILCSVDRLVSQLCKLERSCLASDLVLSRFEIEDPIKQP